MDAVQRTMHIEDLVRDFPGSVQFMIAHGLPCITCGEPVWGTFEDVASKSGKTDAEIDLLLNELNSLIQGEKSP